MGKKNIKPNQPQPIIRTYVAKPALEGLTEENLTNLTRGQESQVAPSNFQYCFCPCSYDGDDAE